MRRSMVVRLTLLPMLASAAVASADPPASELVGPDFDTTLAPPGMSDEILMPPGVTPPIDCREDPDWDQRTECDISGVTLRGGVVRGGFGHYFWAGGG